MADKDTDWKAQLGLADETTSARIYPSKVQKQRWQSESGDKSLSRYIIEHVEEARYHRQKDSVVNGVETSEKRQLENRIEELEKQLENAREPGTPQKKEIYSPEVVKQALTDKPVSQTEILQSLLEDSGFQQLIADRVEKTLYRLAENGEIRYSRNPTGWKLTETQSGGEGQ